MATSGAMVELDQIPGLMSADGAIRAWGDGWGTMNLSLDGPQPQSSLFDYYNAGELNSRYRVHLDEEPSDFFPESLSQDGRLLITAQRSATSTNQHPAGQSTMYIFHLGVPSKAARELTKENVIAPTLLGREPHRSSPHRSDINRDGKSDAADLVH